MTVDQFRKKWLKAFVPDISQEKRKACGADQLLWQVFPFFLEPDSRLVSGEEAEAAYMQADKEGAFCIRTYNYLDLETAPLPTVYWDVKKANRVDELYIVAADWSWTYVSTHENGWFGPYFCKRAIPEYEKYHRNYK